MSFSLTLPPLLSRCFLILTGRMPLRRSALLTTVSVVARISPRTIFPPLSLPSQAKLNSLTAGGAVFFAAVAMGSPRLDRAWAARLGH